MVVVYDPTWGNPTKKKPHLRPQGAFPLSCTYIYIYYYIQPPSKRKIQSSYVAVTFSVIPDPFWVIFFFAIRPGLLRLGSFIKTYHSWSACGGTPQNWTESRNWSHKTSQFGPCLIWFSFPFREDDSPKKPIAKKAKKFSLPQVFRVFPGPLLPALCQKSPPWGLIIIKLLLTITSSVWIVLWTWRKWSWAYLLLRWKGHCAFSVRFPELTLATSMWMEAFGAGGGGEFRMDGMDGGGVRGKRDGKNVWFSKRFLKDAWEF